MLLQALIGLIVIAGVCRQLVLTWRRMCSIPSSMNWIGRKKEVFPTLRACVREMLTGLRSMKAGYFKVRTLKKEMIFTDTFTARNQR